MIINEDLYIEDLHYILRFNHHDFSFYLDRPPRTRLNINFKKHPEMALFRDDPIYEDVNLKLPALKIFNIVSRRIEQLIYKYKIQYWTFSATSMKKADVYEKLLERWMARTSMPFRYDRLGQNFYVYLENNF